MPELTLDHDERDAFVRHLDGVSVPELVRREAPADPGCGGGLVQLGADPGRTAGPAARRATQHTKQRTDGQAGAELEPLIQLLPGAAVHADLTALAAASFSQEAIARLRNRHVADALVNSVMSR